MFKINITPHVFCLKCNEFFSIENVKYNIWIQKEKRYTFVWLI